MFPPAGRVSSRVSSHLACLFLALALAWTASDRPRTAAAVGGAVDAASRAIGASGSAAETPELPAGVAPDWWTAVQARLEADAYAVRPVTATAPDTYVADNPAQRWQARFTPTGLAITPAVPLSRDVRDPRHAPLAAKAEAPTAGVPATEIGVPTAAASAPEDWTVGLRLAAYGASDALTPVPAVAPQAEGARVEFRYGESEAGAPALTEWYVNEARGLEHGFTLAAAPAGAGPLTLELAVAGGLRPVLEPDGSAVELRMPDGAVRLRYAGLFVTDARGRTLPARLAVPAGAPTRIHLVVDLRGAAYPVTVDPLLTGPTPTLTGEAPDNYFGYSVATAGDVNGDGYADVVVGAYGYASFTGRAYVYLGGASGLATTAATTLTGEAAGNFFGYSVAPAGDVNGDGYADVVVGAQGYSDYTGRAYVYLGGATGLTPTSATTLTGEAPNDQFGYSVATAGDVNGDGYTDVVVGADHYGAGFGRAYVYLGGVSGLATTAVTTLTGETRFHSLGWSVATAGDVNGDGYADVVVGAPIYSGNTGRAYVYLGGANGLATTAATTLTGEAVDNVFGYSVAPAGDVNGDGYADVVVGAQGYSDYTGRAYVYLGGATGLTPTAATTLTGEMPNHQFGISVASAGDVNGDGYADVVVGAPSYLGGTGRAYVYLGGTSGLATTASTTLTVSVSNMHGLGYSVATAGDVNGDGYADVVVGAPYYSSATGRAYVYLGGADSLATTAAPTLTGEAAGNYFGYSVAAAGDVNGDGYADVIVGAQGYSSLAGRAYVYLGGATGLATSAATTLTGAADFSFGISVATAGDVNGDGYADVVIGAPGYDSYTGRAYVYLGGASGLATLAATTLTGGAVGERFGLPVAPAGDVNGDGYADVVIGAHGYSGATGRAYVFLGGSGGLATTATTTLTGEATSDFFGLSVAPAGDVNGDGYADVVVGARNYSSSTGRAYVYLGGPGGLATTVAPTLTGEATNDNFGWSVAPAGDVNGDGYADVIVGAVGYSGYTGRAYVFLGGPGGLATTATTTLTGGAANDFFGSSVAPAGDVNGDGYADLVVGAYGYSGNAGRAYVYLGGASGLATAAAPTLTGETAGDQFGRLVAPAGDVNGDGYADVVVGAPGYSGSTGRAYVYAGNGGLGRSVAPRTRRADDSAPVAYGGQSESATGFRVAALGHSPFGRTQVKLEWEVKPLGVAFTGTGTSQSAAWQDTTTVGAALNERVSGVTPSTPYHWRVRVRYQSTSNPFAQYSRWVTQPWGGARETRLRTAPRRASDFTGDLKSDVLWRHATLGEVWLWPMDGAARTGETFVRTVADTAWEIRGLGDQNGDGTADILWRNATTGAIYFWPMDGPTPLDEVYVATVDPAYDIVGTGDYNGDGRTDILWRHLTTGEVWIWLMDGATPQSEVYVATVDPGYVVKGSGDLNGDHKADIVWQHVTLGEVWVWLMNGATRVSETWVATVPDVGYQIAGVADYTGEGKADILWHHATLGEVWMWPMDGTTRLSETWVATVSETDYQIVGTGDYNGDGQADILWHHATLGEVWVWLMDGTTKVSEALVATWPELGYQIIK